MDWICVSIFTSPEGIEPLCGRLYMLGITGTEIEDREDFEEFLENNKQYWDYVDEELRQKMSGETRVKIYISNDEDGIKLFQSIKSDLKAFKSLDTENKLGTLEIKTDVMRAEDWENNWKKFFKPIYIGERLVVKPEWETIPDSNGKIVFNIEPGLTFGSGQHETTRMCVETLDKLVKKGDKVLDFGCGSGILSIIALMLGADYAKAIDIDPNCLKTAYNNAAINGIDKARYKVECGNILSDESFKKATSSEGPFDIVVANIVADVIIPLSKDVHKYIKKGGYFIASGIIEHRFSEVKAEIEKNGFQIQSIRNEKDWYCIVSKA